MEFWIKTCIILCSFGFFKELRPSSPFFTEYLLGPQQNLTESELYYAVMPVWTYSYLSLLVVVFLLTDLLRYKPVIVFEAFGYVITWCLLLWARGVHWMQCMEFFFGIATSTEVAYYTYIYAQVDASHYQVVTSYTRSAVLSGRFASGVLSQMLYSWGLLDYHSLNYVSLASVAVALFIAVMLPPVQKSVYFHRESLSQHVHGNSNDFSENSINANPTGAAVTTVCQLENTKNSISKLKSISRVFQNLWKDFKNSYSDRYLLKWSIWWAFATCIDFQVGNYIQPLWESITSSKESDNLYNGAVEAASTLIGALAAFFIGYLRLDWTIFGEITLCVISFVDAILLIFMGLTDEIWVAYINYIAFRVLYQVLITIASYEVAKSLKAECYGLVFGVNMFVALLIQTFLTIIVLELLELEPGLQFVVYGCYFSVLAILFLIISFYNFGKLGYKGIRKSCYPDE